MDSDKKRVLILGGGFGGIKAALELAKSDFFNITLLSDRTNFRYYPTLYLTATGRSQTSSSIPLKEIFRGKDVRLVEDSAKTVDRRKKTVSGTSGKTYHYDILIVALGVVTNFFGIKGLDRYAYGIKTNDEAKRLRDHLHKQLLNEQQPDLNYVVIGGGPTGVELAGALPGYLRHIMKHHDIAHRVTHVDLVEAESRLVPRMPRPYSLILQKRLRELGVKLYLNQKVEAETADALMVSGHSIKSHTVIWTAGVTNHPFLKANDFGLNQRGRALVDSYLLAEPDIYVIGDNADTKYSGMAQTALYDGLFVAKNLLRLTHGKMARPYKPKKPVFVTPAGGRWAAVIWGKIHLYGWLGWVLRSAADFSGYHDYEPWWLASRHWIAAEQTEEDCPLCVPKK